MLDMRLSLRSLLTYVALDMCVRGPAAHLPCRSWHVLMSNMTSPVALDMFLVCPSDRIYVALDIFLMTYVTLGIIRVSSDMFNLSDCSGSP